MDIQFNKTNAQSGVISITMHEADYASAVEQQLKNYAQNARLKGFRAGAVPMPLIRKKYGKTIRIDEIAKAMEHALHSYIRQEDLSFFMEPLLLTKPADIIELSMAESITFDYEIGLMDPFEFSLGTHITVTDFDITEVGSKLVDEFIEALQLVHGEAAELEISSDNALLYGLLEDDKAAFQSTIRVSLTHVSEPLKEPLIGLRLGDKVALTKEMLAMHPATLLGIDYAQFTSLQHAQLTKPLTFTVHGIVQVTSAPLDSAFFKLVLGDHMGDTLEEFKTTIAKIILFDKRTEARHLCYAKLREQLLAHHSIALPDLFVKKWLLANNPNLTLDAIESYYCDNEDELKWNYLLAKIIKKSDLAVSTGEVLKEAQRGYMAEMRNKLLPGQGMPSDDEIHKHVIAFMNKDNGANFKRLHERLSTDRAVDFIRKQINLQKEKVTAEEFDARKLLLMNA